MGGETQLKLLGEWQIIDIIRQIHSPYTVSYKRDPHPLTIITFNYPCLPRESITVKVRELPNGIDRAVDALKKPVTKIVKS